MLARDSALGSRRRLKGYPPALGVEPVRGRAKATSVRHSLGLMIYTEPRVAEVLDFSGLWTRAIEGLGFGCWMR